MLSPAAVRAHARGAKSQLIGDLRISYVDSHPECYTAKPVRLTLVMPPRELPTGIQLFLDRVTYSCSEPGYVHFRQDVLRKWVGEVADAYENGWDLLREGAIGQLGDEDANAVDRALAVLFVVGNASDAAAVEALLSHPSERVQKSARTCLFEIRRRPAEA